MSLVGETVCPPSDAWRSQQYVLGQLGTAWLHEGSPSAVDYAEEFGHNVNNRSLPERYSDLADLVFADLCVFAGDHIHTLKPRGQKISRNLAARREFAENIADGEEWEILSGINTMTAIISYAPGAYKSTFGNIDTTLNEHTQQLGRILETQQSFDSTVGFLAGLDHDTDQTWETKLSLKPPHTLLIGQYPFVIEDTEHGPTYNVNRAMGEGLESKPAAGCPAKDVLLKKLWDHMVNISVESEFLFSLDLAA
jgi:hypothetical protein